MRKLLSSALLAGAMTAAILAQSAAAQTTVPQSERGMLEVSVTYGAMLSNVITSDRFWMQGGSAEIHGQFYRGLGVVADIAGTHAPNINSSGAGLDLVTATFGPRYTWQAPRARYALFAQILGGKAFGFNGVFPAPRGALQNANSLTTEAGGGINIAISPRIAIRAFEADWQRTQLPNSTTNVQNNVTLGAGIVLRIR